MFQITALEPKITGLQEALPKSIGLLSFEGGVAGNLVSKSIFTHDTFNHCTVKQ